MTIASKVKGIISDGKTLEPKVLTVRFTSNKLGETLSISDDQTVMLLVDYAYVEPLIKKARTAN